MTVFIFVEIYLSSIIKFKTESIIFTKPLF